MKGPRKRYEPKTTRQALGYLVEESGEVLAAAGKSIRWGLGAFNPELPLQDQETNKRWLLREMDDLEHALIRMRRFLAHD